MFEWLIDWLWFVFISFKGSHWNGGQAAAVRESIWPSWPQGWAPCRRPSDRASPRWSLRCAAAAAWGLEDKPCVAHPVAVGPLAFEPRTIDTLPHTIAMQLLLYAKNKKQKQHIKKNRPNKIIIIIKQRWDWQMNKRKRRKAPSSLPDLSWSFLHIGCHLSTISRLCHVSYRLHAPLHIS